MLTNHYYAQNYAGIMWTTLFMATEKQILTTTIVTTTELAISEASEIKDVFILCHSILAFPVCGNPGQCPLHPQT